jgi:hypothetical protein
VRSTDLTGVTDSNLWEYGVVLRKMVADKGYKCIEFVRMIDLLGFTSPGTSVSKDQYIGSLEPSRKALMSRYSDPNFDANACIKNDPDYKLIYDGYAKFLKKDLAHGPIKDAAISGKKFKAQVHDTAKKMIARGVVSPTSEDRLAVTTLLTDGLTNPPRPSQRSSVRSTPSTCDCPSTLPPGRPRSPCPSSRRPTPFP